MMANLSRRERTVIAAGVLVGILLGGWSFVVEPILESNRRAGDLVPAREQMLEKRRDLIARRGVIEAELRSLTERLNAVSARFLTSATPAVAASELQKLVKEMAAQANTEVRSERILPPAERGELLEIPVEIAVSGEVRQLVDLLARLDGAPKLLTVQDFRLRVVNVSQPKELLATLTLSGYRATARLDAAPAYRAPAPGDAIEQPHRRRPRAAAAALERVQRHRRPERLQPDPQRGAGGRGERRTARRVKAEPAGRGPARHQPDRVPRGSADKARLGLPHRRHDRRGKAGTDHRRSRGDLPARRQP